MDPFEDPIEEEPEDATDLQKRSWGWGLLPQDEQATMPGDTNIALINGTPYRWRRVYSHEYQMRFWFQWPEYIEPGQAITHRAWTHRGWGDVGDTGGEIIYALEGVKSHMSFEVQYRAIDGMLGFEARIHFKGDLETDTTKKSGLAQLASRSMPGGSSFLLAGKEGSLISSVSWGEEDEDNASWMQSLLPDLGHFPLKEIIMARSHHAALEDDKFTVRNVGAIKENTVTQIHPVDHQLRVDGIRVLDTRVMNYKGEFYEAHGTFMNDAWYGARGEKLEEVVRQINRFNKEHPGELIIWDFHWENWSSERGYHDLTAEDRTRLFRLLKGIKHLANITTTREDDDITALPLADFIGNKTSSVIIRFHKKWKTVTGDAFPGSREGFFTSDNFPVQDSWSNEYDLYKMTNDQLQKLGEHRLHRNAPLFDQQWLRTLTGVNTLLIPDNMGLIQLGRTAMVTLREHLWNRMTDETYPNWITVDSVDGGEMRGLLKAMNRCFVIRDCGNWVKKPRTREIEKAQPLED